jgi:hypothetical protein
MIRLLGKPTHIRIRAASVLAPLCYYLSSVYIISNMPLSASVVFSIVFDVKALMHAAAKISDLDRVHWD